MEFTLVQDKPDPPKRSRRALGSVVLALVCLLIGAGIDFSLRCLFSTLPSSPRPTFLLIGDSLTQFGSSVSTSGWAAQLQDTYARSADVLNRGVAGKTTRTTIEDVLPALRDELSGWLQPSLITVWLGANDAPDSSGNAPVPLSEYRENLASILQDLMRLAPNAKILLLTPPPPVVGSAQWIESYVGALKTVGDAGKRITIVDVYTHVMTRYPNATERAMLLADGFHLTAAGNNMVFQLVDDQIKRV